MCCPVHSLECSSLCWPASCQDGVNAYAYLYPTLLANHSSSPLQAILPVVLSSPLPMPYLSRPFPLRSSKESLVVPSRMGWAGLGRVGGIGASSVRTPAPFGIFSLALRLTLLSSSWSLSWLSLSFVVPMRSRAAQRMTLLRAA